MVRREPRTETIFYFSPYAAAAAHRSNCFKTQNSTFAGAVRRVLLFLFVLFCSCVFVFSWFVGGASASALGLCACLCVRTVRVCAV